MWINHIVLKVEPQNAALQAREAEAGLLRWLGALPHVAIAERWQAYASLCKPCWRLEGAEDA